MCPTLCTNYNLNFCCQCGAGLRSLTSQTRFTEREGSVKLYVQAVSHWNAKASFTHSQVVYDLHHTHALISEP